jgi:hypothetical protein
VRERCEWNPRFDVPALDPPAPSDCQREAVVCLGDGEWHLCKSCAARPRFKRFKRRTALKQAEGGE